MSRSRRLVAALAAGVLSLGLGAGAAVSIPVASASGLADPGVATADARHPEKVKLALHYLEQINTEVRGQQRTALTEAQIAAANGWNENEVQPGTGTGAVLPAYKVNSDLMTWAQTRANELAQLGTISHSNMWNGSPEWVRYVDTYDNETKSNILKSPQVQWRQEGGALYAYYQFGPENLAMACGSALPQLDFGGVNPAYSWYSELTTAKHGYGHYLAEISQLGTVAGLGVAQSGNCWYAAFEIAYEGVGDDGKTYSGGTTQTVAEARAALEQTEPSEPVKSVTGVEAPAPVTVDSGTNPKPQFPAQVTATFSDETTGPVNVTWDDPVEADYTKREGGTFTVLGTIEGYAPGVTISYTVSPATVNEVVDPQDVTVTQGTTLAGKLPDTVTVKWSNKDETAEPVTWDTDGVKVNVVGEYPVTGQVTSISQKAALTVRVVAATINSVTAPSPVTVAAGTDPDQLGLPDSVSATWSNDTTSDVHVDWAALTDAQKKTLASREGGTITVHGTVAGYEKGVDVTVTVSPATVTSVSLPAGKDAVSTPSGTYPTLPDQALVTWSNGETDVPTAISWPTLKTDQYTKRDGGTETITGTVAGETVKVALTIEPATVTSVDPLATVTTAAKVAPVMPETAHVTWSDKTTSDEPISWSVTPADYAKRTEGKTVTGTILTSTSREYPVSTTLVVTATIASVTNPAGVTTPSGTDPKGTLPAQVDVTYSDDEPGKADVTWEASTKDQYGKREGGTYTLTGTVAGTDKTATITVTVERATVKSVTVDPTTVQVVQGGSLKGVLPETATVTWSNGDVEHPSVSWNTADVKMDVVGEYTATASVEGQSLSVTVKVVAATINSVTAPSPVTVAAGTDPAALGLPGSVSASWSNGTTSDVQVAWAALTDAQKKTLASRAGGSFTVHGTVAGYEKGVDVTVTVSPATVTGVKVATDPVETESGTYPALPEQALVSWSNGETDVPTDITWNVDKALYSTREASTFTAQGTVAGQAVKVPVTVKAAKPVEPVSVDVNIQVTVGEELSLPQTLKVTWSNGDVTDEPVEWDEIPADKLASPGTFDVEGTIYVGGKTPAAGTGTAVSPRLRLALRAAVEGTSASFPVTAHVTVLPKGADASTASVVNQPASGSAAAGATGTSSPVSIATLARTGASVAIAPLAIGCIVAGAVLLVRRRRDA